MKCLSCKEEYGARDSGTCRECYEEAGETEEELKREIEDLKAKVNFLRLLSTGPGGPISISRSSTLAFSDVVLIVSGPTDSADPQSSFPSVPAHRAVLHYLNARVGEVFPKGLWKQGSLDCAPPANYSFR
ncbi:BTB/POZ domain-containing protein [Forsythia ovata]|uniref:BTB/POZ domain-containing protein n=1 Tax=Forsythia ovata TaxID=205694 RepID=A0ABD1PV57_9LAMI